MNERTEKNNIYSSNERKKKGINKKVAFFFAQVNTPLRDIATIGINHTEGGWPKDIGCRDIEATTRYRKRVEKDEVYGNIIEKLLIVSTFI